MLPILNPILANDGSLELVVSELDRINSQLIIYRKNENSNSQDSIEFNTRSRINPNYQLGKKIEEPITKNLSGMYQLVSKMKAENPVIKNKFLRKIASVNLEIGVKVESKNALSWKKFLLKIAKELDGFIFANNNPLFNKRNSSFAFWNYNGKIILDSNGLSEIHDIKVLIDSKYYFK